MTATAVHTAQGTKPFSPLTTHHCVTGSLRNVYQYHGYAISEEMLLGLGAGLGFIYWQMKGIPPLFGGRANFERPGERGLEKVVGDRTGVLVESHYTSSRKKAEAALLDLLAAGEVVMINLDMGFLPYFNLPPDYHFGGHSVVVAGRNAHGDALLADRDGLLHPVPMETLALARGSTFKPFPPMHAWFTFDFANARPPRPDEIRQALRDEVKTMLEPPIANIGVKGIRTAAERLPKWPQTMDETELRGACWSVHLYIDAKGGTGGGIFRYLYSRFLDEAAPLLGEPALHDVARDLKLAGDQWQDVAALLTTAAEAPDPVPALNDAAARLRAIAEKEERAWGLLRTVVG